MDTKKELALLHIGGGELQKEGVIWAKELGLKVIVTDINKSAPAARYADEFWNISGEDVEKLMGLAKIVNTKYKLTGVHTSSDFGLQAVSIISEELCLGACSLEALNNALNKQESSKKWASNNLDCTVGAVVSTLQQARMIIEELNYPVILKPVVGCGSQGIQSVDSNEKIEGAFNNAKNISRNVRIEKLLKGRHVDVNGLFINDTFYECGTFDVHFCEPPYHYPIWSHQPSLITHEQERKIYQIVERGSRVLGINTGPVKADVIWAEDRLYLIEITPRFQGDVATIHLTPKALGINPLKAYFSYLSGHNDWNRYLLSRQKQYAGWRALLSNKSGTLRNIQGVSKVKNAYKLFLNIHIDQTIREPTNNNDICGFIWAAGDSISDLRSVLKEECSNIVLDVK